MNDVKNKTFSGELVPHSGILEIMENGKFGQLIDLKLGGYVNGSDPYVGHDLLKKFELRRGQWIDAHVMPRSNFPNGKVISIDHIDGLPVERVLARPKFFSMESTMPREQLYLENSNCTISSRVLDLFCPLAKGQRGLVVAPPRTGKTLLLHEIARGISVNYPNIKIIVALIDERPEEVTDFRRSVDVEIFASPNDQPMRNHIRIAELACERAKNLVELGHDVVVLLDSITRLARAYNSFSSSGRTMSGGVDSRALEKPRQLFSLARDFAGRGSLTILASALVETGSRMDDLIFQEFKGTGNAEIVFNRKLAEQRVWPAIDLKESGVRREENILSPEILRSVSFLRRAFGNMRSEEATESILQRMKQTRTNAEFLGMLKGV
ncbi:MAG: transcription termination factor Rho [Puniceicoccales bacterium]|jgi:transcription termination factor Rho|nr:transcription termination factor Rho [Puniceicoccales bacterium]